MPQKKPRAKKSEVRPLPSREEILAFVAEHPGKAGKREIARAFGISGGDRIALKQMLRELDEDGLVQKHRGRLERPGDLPAVAVLTITARDSDGEFLAEPAEWREDGGPPPKGIILADRKRAGPAPGIGDRVLARLTPVKSGGLAFTARVIKVLERQPITVLGVVRLAPGGARLEPVDRKQKEMALEPDGLGRAQGGRPRFGRR